MKYVNLGNTDLKISVEGLGCMGMSEFYGKTDSIRSKKVLLSAIEWGVNFFDTADIYGFGDNEKLIGEVIRNRSIRDNLVLSTKCGIIRDSNNMQKRGVDNSYDYIIDCCDSSLNRLGTTIDLYYLHRVIDNKDNIDKAMDAMAFLLKNKKIKAVGLSEVNENNIRYANECLLSKTKGLHSISAVQSEYSLVSRGVESNGVLDACDELGITFVAYSPISRGLLSGSLGTLEQLSKDDFSVKGQRYSEQAMKSYSMDE